MIHVFARCVTGPVSLHLLAAHLLTLGPAPRQCCFAFSADGSWQRTSAAALAVVLYHLLWYAWVAELLSLLEAHILLIPNVI